MADVVMIDADSPAPAHVPSQEAIGQDTGRPHGLKRCDMGKFIKSELIEITRELVRNGSLIHKLLDGPLFFIERIKRIFDDPLGFSNILGRGRILFDSIMRDLRLPSGTIVKTRKSFIMFIVDVFLAGLSTCSPDDLMREYGDIMRADRKAEITQMCNLAVIQSLLVHYIFLFDDLLSMPAESLRLILSSKFPRAEKFFYQFKVTITPDGESGSHRTTPRFSKLDLVIMVLSTYMYPAISTPLGIALAAHILDSGSSYSRKRIACHARNMSTLGVLSWYYTTIVRGNVSATLTPKYDTGCQDLIARLISEYSVDITARFLEHFGYDAPKVTNVSCLTATRKFIEHMNRYEEKKEQLEKNLSGNKRKRSGTSSDKSDGQGLYGIQVPRRNTCLFHKPGQNKVPDEKGPLFADSMDREGGYLPEIDRPINILFLQSIISSAISNTYILLRQRTSRDIETNLEAFRIQLNAGDGHNSHIKGPIHLLLNNTYHSPTRR
jgi:hypothetical protein